ncbi:hypothetical protein [Citrobacter freundii]|uniref:hypothetical protein n=1 Tax=Citrobacter freundii TaxID=546 RepID=UPI00070E6168|nr:hypothetical protein [Citrobacter freundii]EJC8216199.1 hypothetical protein [Citrobacter freundii]
MTTNNHPAHGPLSLDRLHQIREILSKAAAQSDGGNLGYAMADAVKVIDGAIAAFGAEPVAYIFKHPAGRLFWALTDEGNKEQSDVMPVYAAPRPAPLMPDEMAISDDMNLYQKSFAQGHNACRAAMLQAGNSPVIPDCWCRTCRPVTMSDMRFVVCPDCGNKRCPHANDHRNACTGSNEPGQEGSAYPAAPQQEVKNV